MNISAISPGLLTACSAAFLVFLMGNSCKPTPSKTPVATDTVKVPVDKPDNGNAARLEAILPGSWKTTWLHVEMVTWRGVDTERLVEEDEETWFQAFGRDPLVTEYKKDHSFQWHYLERDTMVYGPLSNWKVSGDSMFTDDPEQPLNNYRYKYIIHSDTLIELRTKVDWDFDGTKDDLYYSKYRKLKK